MNQPANRIDEATKHVPAPQRSSFAKLAKRCAQLFFFLWVVPRFVVLFFMTKVIGNEAFRYASESISSIPGLRGIYQRQAFYGKRLASCGRDVHFGWLSVLSMKEAEIGDRVYIGRSCSIGFARIESEVMLADQVQLLSGGKEHGSARGDSTMQQQGQFYQRITVGHGAWIGAGAIVMADVGPGAIIGAGAVVNNAVPAHSVAVGVPARVVKQIEDFETDWSVANAYLETKTA